MSFITKKLEEFEERFVNISPATRDSSGDPIPVAEYLNVGDADNIRSFLSTALDEMIKEVEKGLPEYSNLQNVSEYWSGYNACLKEIKQSLSSLREGNK